VPPLAPRQQRRARGRRLYSQLLLARQITLLHARLALEQMLLCL